MKYRHVATGLEKEAEAGALHYPWIPADPVDRGRQAAREVVADRLGPKPDPKPKHKRKAAADA